MSQYICNPLNLEYRYQIKKSRKGDSVFREAADPTVLLFRGTYYMFASMSGGFWYSNDLCNWTHKETPELPIYDYAPDVREIDGRIIFSASRRNAPCSFWSTEDPLKNPFTPVAATFEFWDPNIFQDDNGRVFFYWGCSNREPIYGIEVDPKTFQPLTEKVALINENEMEHGWERKGENAILEPPKTEIDKMIRQYTGTKPHIEGAYMTKHDGKYYLQYAAPGTEYNLYGDGVYLSEHPLGPFEYQEHNPFSSKPGGFIAAAGHGSTFQDKFGNWWHMSTMRISANENFERRIGLFPCSFDDDGILYCNQNFADYPFKIPEGPFSGISKTVPDLQLISYNKKATASSNQKGYGSELGVNEDVRSWWAAERAGDQEWYQLDLGKTYKIQAAQINFADHKIPFPKCNEDEMHKESFGYRKIEIQPKGTEYLLEGSLDGMEWFPLKNTIGLDMDLAHDFISFDNPPVLRYIRLSHMKMPFNNVPAISGLRVFGKGNGKMPDAIRKVNVSRESRQNILLKWDHSFGADGYNVRYGIAPGKLYNSWQLYGACELDLCIANTESSYYIAVDSFNENGVTVGKIFFVK